MHSSSQSPVASKHEDATKEKKSVGREREEIGLHICAEKASDGVAKMRVSRKSEFGRQLVFRSKEISLSL